MLRHCISSVFWEIIDNNLTVGRHVGLVPVEIIKKKRDRHSLSAVEIEDFIRGFVAGEIPDYQVASWLMAIFLNGMDSTEASALTKSMLHSGEVLNFSEIPTLKVDKHSTGGVGDKTSLILAPLVAAAGITVPMISGRGLGHTGGTLDKLESIPGFSTSLNLTEFRHMLVNVGVSLIGQTENICPADKKLYALRDVTGTVESLPLICSSIMSKKLAEGIDGLVLDVKFGSGAFMKDLDSARTLAQSLINIGKSNGKKISALLTSMQQPLGRFIGNALEVEECIAIMKQENLRDCPLDQLGDTTELSLELAGQMIFLGGQAENAAEGVKRARQILHSGAAFEKFQEICHHQGGDLSKLPKAKLNRLVLAKQSGFISAFNTEQIGMSALLLGAGRKTQNDVIDPTAGLQMHAKLGTSVKKGDPLFTLYSSTAASFEEAECRLHSATEYSAQKVSPPKLIEERL